MAYPIKSLKEQQDIYPAYDSELYFLLRINLHN